MKPPNSKLLKDALDFLKARDRFTSEVRSHLDGKGYEREDVEYVVQFLT